MRKKIVSIYLLYTASIRVLIHILIISIFIVRYSRETRKSFERAKCISFEVGSLPRSCTLIHAGTVHHDNNYIIIIKISYNDLERIYVPSKILRLSYVLFADQYSDPAVDVIINQIFLCRPILHTRTNLRVLNQITSKHHFQSWSIFEHDDCAYSTNETWNVFLLAKMRRAANTTKLAPSTSRLSPVNHSIRQTTPN